MKTAIDRSGRIVVPKAIRDRLSLRGGEELEIVERDGLIEIWPAPLEVDLVKTPEGVVAKARKPVPPLTADAVRDALERVRR
jgi:AbrB family looped-hinge helix DNA binding protein